MESIGHLRHTKGIAVVRDPKGIHRNLAAFQRDFAEDPMEFKGIPKGHSLQQAL